MRTQYALTIALLCLPTIAQAEPVVGGKGGLNAARWIRHSSEPSPVERTYKYGFVGGGYLQLRYLEALLPQLELMFTNRGTDSKLNDENVGLFKLNYIDLLLLARAELPIGDTTIYGLAGPELSLLLTASVRDGFGATSDVREDNKPIDVGLLIGAGVAIGPFSWGTLIIEARYDRGLINVDKGDEADGITFTNQTVAFLVGYEYRRDRDGDGIADDRDRCPRQAEDRDGFEDSDGCPDPDVDHNSDGVSRTP